MCRKQSSYFKTTVTIVICSLIDWLWGGIWHLVGNKFDYTFLNVKLKLKFVVKTNFDVFLNEIKMSTAPPLFAQHLHDHSNRNWGQNIALYHQSTKTMSKNSTLMSFHTNDIFEIFWWFFVL